MSRLLILMGSPRKNGNTASLARAFAEGASEHHEVETVNVCDYEIAPCTGCNACFKSEGNRCVRRDDMDLLYEKLKSAEILVCASPLYFYGVSAQLKAVIDRLHNPVRKQFPIRKLALLCAAGADFPGMFDGVLAQYRLILNYFHLEDSGTLCVPGVRKIGDIEKTEALERARELGRMI